MTLSEFKAWFEGFNENISGRPNEKQWKRIKARVKDIDGAPVTPLVIREYVDRYHYPNYWYGYPNNQWGSITIPCSSTSVSAETWSSSSTVNLSDASFSAVGDTTACLATMGAAEAKSLM